MIDRANVPSIGRTILRPYKDKPTRSYIPSEGGHPVHLLGFELKARGLPFQQQERSIRAFAAELRKRRTLTYEEAGWLLGAIDGSSDALVALLQWRARRGIRDFEPPRGVSKATIEAAKVSARDKRTPRQ